MLSIDFGVKEIRHVRKGTNRITLLHSKRGQWDLGDAKKWTQKGGAYLPWPT